ncbi:MAG: hypothetical protein MJZ20_10045 [Bacteroidaceae bacterium]|nr:hypothetical protein [Bacteroidaceae bacterium]
MKVRTSYMLSHDIDWFAEIACMKMHFASNGSIIPITMEVQELRSMQRKVAEMPEVFLEDELIINESYLTFVVNRQREIYNNYLRSKIINDDQTRSLLQEREYVFDREWYLSSFKSFAKKGFISCDWDNELQQYIWVARPKSHEELQIALPPLTDNFICKNVELFRAIGLAKIVIWCLKNNSK